MQLLQSVTSLILLTFSRCATSSGSSSRFCSASKIEYSAGYSLVTGVFLTFILTVTTVTSNIKEGKKLNKINSYTTVTVVIKNHPAVTLLLHTVTQKM